MSNYLYFAIAPGIGSMRGLVLVKMLLVTSFLLVGCTSQSDWKQVNQGEPAHQVTWTTPYKKLSGIWTADGKEVWAVGVGSTVLHSNDGGATWQRQHIDSNASLNAIYGRDEGLWVVGNQGTIFHSTDGGATWQRQHIGPTPSVSGDHDKDLRAIYGRGKELWVVGWENTVLYSADEGATWRHREVGTRAILNAVYGSDRGLWVVGEDGSILHSTDGGANWENQYFDLPTDLRSRYGGGNDLPPILHDIYSRGKEFRGIYGSGKDLWVVGTESSEGIISHSSDGGATWQHQYINPQENLNAIYGSGRELWVVGSGGEILHSSDGGDNWETQHTDPTGDLNAIYGSGRELWAVGYRDSILHSADGGFTWQQQHGGPTTGLNALYSSGKELWAVGREPDPHGVGGSGSDGLILHSVDDGLNWAAQTPGTCGELKGIYGTNKQLWVVGKGGFILHSGDGGENWEYLDGDSSWDLNAIYRNEKELWAVGDQRGEGLILHSVNEGVSWLPQTVGPPLTAIYGNGKQLWVVGAEGTILFSSDGGYTWQHQHVDPTIDLDAIYGGGKELWAAGNQRDGAKGIVLHSADGGVTWSAQTLDVQTGLVSRNLSGMYASGKELWIVGAETSGGLVLHSADGGATWWGQTVGENEHLRAICASGKGLCAVGEQGGIFRGIYTGSYPAVTRARVMGDGVKARLEFQIDSESGEPDKTVNATLWGASDTNFKEGIIQEVHTAKLIPPVFGSNLWAFTFLPGGPPLHLESGQMMDLAIQLNYDKFSQRFPFLEYAYEPWAWIKKSWPWLVPTGFVILVPLAFTVLLFTWPLGILKLYHRIPIDELVKEIPLPGVAAAILRGALQITILPLFVRHSRTLDAWVKQHLETVRNCFEDLDTVHRSLGYVPLPITEYRSKSTIEKPSAKALSAFFRSPRSVVQILGPGGAGKTTLAIQIGRWAFGQDDEERLARHQMLPILIEEDTNDLPAVIRRKLTALLNEKIEDELLNALLEKKRLLVIVERLSERNSDTQTHVCTIHGSVPINALLITTRYALTFDAGGSVTLSPRPLNSATLLNFMTTLLQSALDAGGFRTIDDQLALGRRIAKLIELDGVEIPLTPLLVRLFVEKAIALVKANDSLDRLPSSIPEIYFDYLRSLNPQDGEVINRMEQDEMLRLAETLSRLSTGETFVPKEFLKVRAQDLFAKMGFTDPDKVNGIQRLIDNGVLIVTTAAGATLLRFTLDPVAEYLAAAAWAKDCGNDERRWEELITEVRMQGKTAAGFLTALRLVWQAYAERFDWPRNLNWN